MSYNPGSPCESEGQAYLACELLAVNSQHKEVARHLLVKVVGYTQQQVCFLCEVDEAVLYAGKVGQANQ